MIDIDSVLPGGVVRQEVIDSVFGDCFSACISMLTGIPLDYLPVYPPLMLSGFIPVAPHVDDLRQYLARAGDTRVINAIELIPSAHSNYHLLKEDWNAWDTFLRDTGFEMTLCNSQPAGPSIVNVTQVFAACSHAMVAIDDVYVNPGNGEIVKQDLYHTMMSAFPTHYAVVTPLGHFCYLAVTFPELR